MAIAAQLVRLAQCVDRIDEVQKRGFELDQIKGPVEGAQRRLERQRDLVACRVVDDQVGERLGRRQAAAIDLQAEPVVRDPQNIGLSLEEAGLQRTVLGYHINKRRIAYPAGLGRHILEPAIVNKVEAERKDVRWGK